jgi:hypothetical protein
VPKIQVQSATQQEDGSIRVVCADGCVCFVPNADGNRDFEHIAREIVAGRVIVVGATRDAQLTKTDMTLRLAARESKLKPAS